MTTARVTAPVNSARHAAAADAVADLRAGDAAVERDDPTRAVRRRRQALIMQQLIAASYGVDALFIGAFVALGVLDPTVSLLHLVAFAVLCGGTSIALHLDLGRHLRDPYLVLPQLIGATLLQFAVMRWVPEIGLAALTGLFIVVGFAGLRLSLLQATFVSAWLTLGVCGLFVLGGERLALPLASGVERLVSGLWLSTMVARVIMLGQYGLQLRKALVRRNEDLHRTMAIAERLASRDGLTGILNRASILKAIDVERARMHRSGQPFSVALLDLDNFKRVNDAFGHLVGDQVLVGFVEQVAAGLRPTDELGRYGGEEFLVVLNGADGPVAARWAVERIVRSIEARDWSGLAPDLRVTTSAGIATCGRDETVTQLLSRADGALYRAKNTGRNRVCAG